MSVIFDPCSALQEVRLSLTLFYKDRDSTGIARLFDPKGTLHFNRGFYAGRTRIAQFYEVTFKAHADEDHASELFLYPSAMAVGPDGTLVEQGTAVVHLYTMIAGQVDGNWLTAALIIKDFFLYKIMLMSMQVVSAENLALILIQQLILSKTDRKIFIASSPQPHH